MELVETGFSSERDIPKLFVNAIGALAVRQEAEKFLEESKTSPTTRHIDMGIGHVISGNQIELSVFGEARGIKYDYSNPPTYDRLNTRWALKPQRRTIAGSIGVDGTDVRLTDVYTEYQRSSIREKFNARGIVRELLAIDPTVEPDNLIKATIDCDNTTSIKSLHGSYYWQVVEAFSESGHLDHFLSYLSEMPEATLYEPFVVSLNRRVSTLYNKAERDSLHSDAIRDCSVAIQLADLLDEYNLVRANEFWSLPMMSNPHLANIIASTEGLGKMFDNFSFHARRNMGIMLVEKLLNEYAQPDSGRNEHNAALIKKVLFNEKSYKRDLPLLELIKLANQFTTRLNQSKLVGKKQELLPVDGIGASMLTNSGEALFRVLSMTNAAENHLEQNRDIATIFDALLEADYRRYAKSRPVTVADICARYPDANGDIVLDLQESARTNGYSAATRLYKETRRQHGKRVFFEKRKTGKGIIS